VITSYRFWLPVFRFRQNFPVSRLNNRQPVTGNWQPPWAVKGSRILAGWTLDLPALLAGCSTAELQRSYKHFPL